jgi:hypothetical protein
MHEETDKIKLLYALFSFVLIGTITACGTFIGISIATGDFTYILWAFGVLVLSFYIIITLSAKLKKERKENPYGHLGYRNPVKRRSIPIKLRDEIFRRDNYICQYCGREINEIELEVDHILPISKGGTNSPSNLQTLCVKCNQQKGNK